MGIIVRIQASSASSHLFNSNYMKQFRRSASWTTRVINTFSTNCPSKLRQCFAPSAYSYKMASSLALPDSRQLSYSLDASPENSPLVVLSNSLTAPFTAWDHVVKVLNQGGFRTLRYDQPGHGDSSVPQPLDANTFDTMAADVYTLLQTLSIEKVHGWIGVSMGAATGIQFVTKYPGVVDRIVICDTISSSPVNAGTDDLFGPRVETARREGSLETVIQGTLERWFGSAWLDANSGEAERMRALMRRTSINGFETCCHALRSKTFDLRPLFSKVGGGVDKALCVVGEKDANLPQTMETMRAEIEQGFRSVGKNGKVDLKVIKNAGHVCFIDGFQDFCEVVVPFLK